MQQCLYLEQIRYRALVYAWLKYATLPEMAGVGLQKQTFVAAGKGVHLSLIDYSCDQNCF